MVIFFAVLVKAFLQNNIKMLGIHSGSTGTGRGRTDTIPCKSVGMEARLPLPLSLFGRDC